MSQEWLGPNKYMVLLKWHNWKNCILSLQSLLLVKTRTVFSMGVIKSKYIKVTKVDFYICFFLIH